MMSTLVLQPSTLRQSSIDGDAAGPPAPRFLDFVVDGQALRTELGETEDLVTEFNRPWLEYVPEAVEALLGRRQSPDLERGRVALLVCGICGDLGCGAVTAAIEFHPGRVRWADFRWQDGRAGSSPPVQGAPALLDFDRDRYEQALLAAYGRVAEFPYDPRAERGRAFLWPWQWGWRLPRRMD